mgnify:CR=1 FL=1
MTLLTMNGMPANMNFKKFNFRRRGVLETGMIGGSLTHPQNFQTTSPNGE